MLIAVSAFLGYFKHLHPGAYKHIVSRSHSAFGEKIHKVFLFRLLNKRAQIIGTDTQLAAHAR